MNTYYAIIDTTNNERLYDSIYSRSEANRKFNEARKNYKDCSFRIELVSYFTRVDGTIRIKTLREIYS